MHNDLLKAVTNGEEKKVYKLVRKMVNEGFSQAKIQTIMRQGLECAWAKYVAGDFFIADLIVAGQLFKDVLELPDMIPPVEKSNAQKRHILIGTVAGDAHDIGKNIIISLLRYNGFSVIDLGVDVPVEAFVEGVRTHSPYILALSGLMLFSVEVMRETVEAIEKEGLRQGLKIILGGNFVENSTTSITGADAASSDANKTLSICQKWANENG